MHILEKKYNDFSEQDDVIEKLRELYLHLKPSLQKNKNLSPIFDPVGTNRLIKEMLIPDWEPNLSIPKNYKDLGTDVDYYKDGSIIEVQFSNYPFLANNLLRSEVFFKSNELIFKDRVKNLTFITKSKKLPSSNSSLSYEQAENQLDIWRENEMFSIPVRLIGITIDETTFEEGIWTEYSGRTSTEIISSNIEKFSISFQNKKYSFTKI